MQAERLTYLDELKKKSEFFLNASTMERALINQFMTDECKRVIKFFNLLGSFKQIQSIKKQSSVSNFDKHTSPSFARRGTEGAVSDVTWKYTSPHTPEGFAKVYSGTIKAGDIKHVGGMWIEVCNEDLNRVITKRDNIARCVYGYREQVLK